MKKPLKYDARVRAVSKALERVEAPGDYYTTGTHASFPLPGLVVEGMGEVLLPLTDMTAKALIAACHLAPFGHGEHTLVDTQVRNTWELSTDQFKIDNPAFNAFVKDQIAEACRTPLGIHARVEFEAKLYKLLLYEPGGKFDRHQDSEKESGMFGTLVVVLPGRFEGGELVVHHPSAAGQKEKTKSETTKSDVVQVEDTRVFDAGAMDPFMIKYAAFYGDCPHEVKAVTKGYRLCLTYNLVKIASSSPMPSLSDPHFGSNHELYATLKSALENFFSADGVENKKRQRVDTDGSSSPMGFDVTDPDSYRPCKLVYVLTHKYTDANLSFENLKNRDEAVAASLARFCDSSDGALGLYLCKMEYRFEWHGNEGSVYVSDQGSEQDEGDSESDGDGNEGGDKDDDDGDENECGDGDDDDDDDNESEDDDDDGGGEDDDGDEYVTRSLGLKCPLVEYNVPDHHAVLSSGTPGWNEFSKGDLTAEVVPCGFFNKKGFKFDGENSSLYTGNEGSSCDRWYGSAALVVAPFELVARWILNRNGDPTELLGLWSQLAGSKPALARAVSRAFHGCSFHCSTTSPAGVRILEAATKINDLDLVCSVIAGFQNVAFQPKLRDVLGHYDQVKAVKQALEEHVKKWGYYVQRSTIYFIASILDGVTDASVISAALDTIDAVPYMKSKDLEFATVGENDTTPEEFLRVLKLASLVSLDCVKSLLDASSDKSLVMIVAPAIRLLFDATKDNEDKCVVVLSIANYVLELLKQKLPVFRDAAYKWGVACQSGYRSHWSRIAYSTSSYCDCDELNKFVKSTQEEATFTKHSFESHLKGKLEGVGLLDRFTVEPSSEDTGSKVVLKKTYEQTVFKRAEQEMAQLEKLVAEFVRVAVVSGDRASRSE